MPNDGQRTTDGNMTGARVRFVYSIRQLGGVAVLLWEHDGQYEPLFVSSGYARMMGSTADETLRLMKDVSYSVSTIEEDRALVADMLKNRKNQAVGSELEIRKLAATGRVIWTRAHFAFINHVTGHYVYITYSDISKTMEYETYMRAVYERTRAEFDSRSDDSRLSLRLNLTRGIVEECRGSELYGMDVSGNLIDENIDARLQFLPIPGDRRRFMEKFGTEKLIESAERGVDSVSEVFFSRRPDGSHGFVRYDVRLRREPVSGDIVAFATETNHNEEIVNETILRKAMSGQYDMVTYISAGRYGVVIGDATHIGKGSIFPREKAGDYETYITNEVIPFVTGSFSEREATAEALSLARVRRELTYHEPYVVDISLKLGVEVFYKRFVFYSVRREADFYVLLKADTTAIKRGEVAKNEQLESALAKAWQANVAKTTFLSNMSHDIRTPMNAIIGFTDLAMRNPADTEKVAEYLAKIKASSSHLLSLINDVLEMSRIESGKIELDETVVSLPEVLHNLNTIIVGQAEAKRQELYMDAMGVTDENIYCDKLRLNQVLLNLLSNAIKYTPAGGRISLKLSQHEGAPEGWGAYEIRVKDNGMGMTKEFAARIFDAFTRERSSDVSDIQGTGLGMAITKQIVDLMQGTIDVETEKGKGSEFIVKVNFRIAGRSVQDFGIEELAGTHTLVVDDDFDACDGVSKMLTKFGMRPAWTMSGKEAVLRTKQAKELGEDFGLYIIDWKLPDLGGIEVVRQIRGIAGEKPAIILMTAYDWVAVRDEAISAGVNGFSNKPVFMSELYQTLLSVVGRKMRTEKRADEPKDEMSFAGKRILLTDDMDVNREIGATVLEMSGFTVEQATNGEEAIKKVAESKPGYYDAVLMDIQMPVMNGYAAARAIRALPDRELSEIPILAMTANAFDEDRKAALEAGMNGHIAKPIDAEKLIEELKKVL